MIKNYMCNGCNHKYVCSILGNIEKFSSEAKKPNGVDIQVLGCKEYDGDGEVFNEEEV